MAASGRDVVTFAVGLALAGVAPVVFMPSLSLSAVLGAGTQLAAAIPLEHVAFVAFVAVLLAAWVDTDGTGSPSPDVDRWD